MESGLWAWREEGDCGPFNQPLFSLTYSPTVGAGIFATY